ncbi:MAG: DUF1636 family protein [Paracoccus sp. (in: a-proteobacteria)]|nr:DUF1636 family protein [Paracoccus sp. (in: a-proteobacteria)]
MTCPSRRPVAAHTHVSARNDAQRLLICQTCPHTGAPCRPGLDLLARLRLGVAAAAMSDDFEISGTVHMTQCTRPCTVAFQAGTRETWIFGDTCPSDCIEDLVMQCRRQGNADGAAVIIRAGEAVAH